MISPSIALASATPRAVFPVAVGPTTQTTRLSEFTRSITRSPDHPITDHPIANHPIADHLMTL
jgi:hypothetical protein